MPSSHSAVTPYTAEFFDAHADDSSRSADAVVPRLCEWFHPHSVVGVGCGIGTWLSAFRAYGVEDLVGLDGDYVDRTQLRIPATVFWAHDLTQPVEPARTF